MGYLLRLPGLEPGGRQVSLLVPVHRGRARCETLRYSTVGGTGDQGLVDGLVLGAGADGASPGHNIAPEMIQSRVERLYDVDDRF